MPPERSKEFVIGTEMSIAGTPGLPVPESNSCSRKAVAQYENYSLMDVYRAIAGTGGDEFNL
jgi:hypothetical protein